MPRKVKFDPEHITNIYKEAVSKRVRDHTQRWINQESLRLITKINEDMKMRIQNVLRDGVEHGDQVATTASRLLKTGLDKGIFRSARKRAWLIARTELHRARQRAAIDIYKANKVNTVKWKAIADNRICSNCLSRENKHYHINEIIDSLPPIHPRCRCRVIPADIQLNIQVKHGHEGKVLETKIAPNPNDYKYIILKKSLVPVKGHSRKGYFIKPHMMTLPYSKDDDAKFVAQKYSISVSNLQYVGIQRTEGFVGNRDSYWHMWNIIKPGHEKHGSTVIGKLVKSIPDDQIPSSSELKIETSKVDTNPSDAQKEAGNYEKGHINLGGLDITIENPKGSYRSGKDKDGNPWKTQLHTHYGYIKSTIGKDKDHLDVMLGDDLSSDRVFIVNQVNQKGDFDEHKILLGFHNKEEASKGYLSNYESGWKGLGSIVERKFDDFKKWALEGNTVTELEKARPYIRTRRGRLEHVKGYQGKPRVYDLSFKDKLERFINPNREDVKIVNRIAFDINAAGGRALIIGGAVRDALLGRESKDVDVEVYGIRTDELKSILERSGKVDAVGANFGVLKVSTPDLDEPIDISIPRRDNKIGKGHKGFMVEPDPSMTVDDASRRRDLTINAISYDPLTKEIVDPFNGLQDLKAGVLRAVDENTFVEDPLRVLRVAQFASRLGFIPDANLVSISRNVDLKELPRERIYTELEKLLLKSKKPSIGLRLFDILGINKQLFPEFVPLKENMQDPKWHPEGDTWSHTLMVMDEAARLKNRFSNKIDQMVFMLSALLHDISKPDTTGEREDGRIISHGHAEHGAEKSKEILSRLTSDSVILENVPPLIKYHMAPQNLYQAKAGSPAIRRLSKKVDIPMLIALGIADVKGRGLEAERTLKPHIWLLKRFKQLKLDKPETLVPKVMGRNLIQIGVKPGPEMGRILDRIYQAQLDGKFETLDDGIEYARKEGWIDKSIIKEIPVIDKSKSDVLNKKIKQKNLNWFLKKIDNKLRWVKFIDKDIIVVKGIKPKLGDKVLVKGFYCDVTAIGKDGITARDLYKNKYLILKKDVNFIVKSL